MISMAGRLRELAGLFLKLGILGFGGPAAHIAMMQDEVCERRDWLTREAFLDLVGATNLIPGPNSTEMAIHVGYLRGGWPGLLVAGSCFLVPAVLISGGFGWFYATYGTVPAVAPFLFGIKPAVMAVILMAVLKLGQKAVKDRRCWVLGIAVAVAVLCGVSEVIALLTGGVVGMFWFKAARKPKLEEAAAAGLALVGGLSASKATAAPVGGLALAATAVSAAVPVSLTQLGLFFLKVGAILYGSGYVLVAFLQGGLVDRFGWLTQQQLLDAVAVGQFTPGPVLSTATFIGYLIAGPGGAAVATAGIFLPSFLFVALLNPLVPKLRQSPWTAAFLDAVNVSAVALMAAVVIELGRATVTSWPAAIIAILSAIVLFRWKVNAAWIVLGAAILGWPAGLLR
jgi:chromate transporter